MVSSSSRSSSGAAAGRLDALRLQMARKAEVPRWQASRSSVLSLRSYGKDIRSQKTNNNKKIVSSLLRFASRDVGDWSVKDVGDWVESLGVDRFPFEKNQMSGAELMEIGLDDLDYLEIKILAHRKKILKGIAELREQSRKEYDELPPEPPKRRTHWTETKPLSKNQVSNEGLGVNSCDTVPLSTNGNWSFLDGALDEEAEHDAFRRAVDAWRNNGDDTKHDDLLVDTKHDVSSDMLRRSAQDVADDLAQRLDAAHVANIADIARRKQLAEDRLKAIIVAKEQQKAPVALEEEDDDDASSSSSSSPKFDNNDPSTTSTPQKQSMPTVRLLESRLLSSSPPPQKEKEYTVSLA